MSLFSQIYRYIRPGLLPSVSEGNVFSGVCQKKGWELPLDLVKLEGVHVEDVQT